MNGKEALEMIISSQSKGVTYAIIFMDYSMPIMDGITATKKIREYFQEKNEGVHVQDQVKIMGCTGHVGENFNIEGLESGMNEILSKPVYLNILKSKL